MFCFSVDAEHIKKLGTGLTAIAQEKSKAQKVSQAWNRKMRRGNQTKEKTPSMVLKTSATPGINVTKHCSRGVPVFCFCHTPPAHIGLLCGWGIKL